MLCAFLFSCKPTPDGGEEGGQTTNNDLKEYVDLGLPSGTLWATCNVGASSPEEFGKYYAWGEITTKDTYTKENSLTYGIKMNDISANPKFDAATANWGKDWRMPTKTETEELYDKCSWIMTSHNDINGYKVVGPNGNSIFLPAAGLYYRTILEEAGLTGSYYTSTPENDNKNNTVYCLGLWDWLGYDIDNYDRYSGGSVRAVRTEGFEPMPQYAMVTTTAVTEMTDNYVICGGDVTTDNGSPVIARGVCWGTNENPTLDDNYTVDGSGCGKYTSTIDVSSLPLYTPCCVRAYATTSVGVSYGKQIVIMKEGKASGSHSGYDYVDLGLSVKWATCNLGATSAEQYGNYYAWGETSTKETYDYDNCPTYGLSISQLQSQGYIDGECNLTPQYDAATVNWGGDWRMPTYAELSELIYGCTWTWMVNGYKVTGPNGNSIFLPAAGRRDGSSLGNAGSRGYYWSSRPCYDDYAYDLYFDSDDHYMSEDGHGRDYGRSVRPVLE